MTQVMRVWGRWPQRVQGVVRSTLTRDALAFLKLSKARGFAPGPHWAQRAQTRIYAGLT